MSRYKADVKVAGNGIGGRQGWAYVFNSGKVVVLDADLDKEQEYGDYKTFGRVRVLRDSKTHGEMLTDGTLEWEAKRGWSIGQSCCCISANFGFYDFMEDLENALAPTITADSIVAIAEHSKERKTGVVRLYNVGRIDAFCETICHLEPLTEDEMQVIAQDVQKWVDR